MKQGKIVIINLLTAIFYLTSSCSNDNTKDQKINSFFNLKTGTVFIDKESENIFDKIEVKTITDDTTIFSTYKFNSLKPLSIYDGISDSLRKVVLEKTSIITVKGYFKDNTSARIFANVKMADIENIDTTIYFNWAPNE